MEVGNGQYLGASAKNMSFKNVTLYDIGLFKTVFNNMFRFINVGIHTQTRFYFNYAPAKEYNTRLQYCRLYNAHSKLIPSAWKNLGNPKLVTSTPTISKGPEQFIKQSNSPWIDAGTGYGSNRDFEGTVLNNKRDIGAFEYN